MFAVRLPFLPSPRTATPTTTPTTTPTPTPTTTTTTSYNDNDGDEVDIDGDEPLREALSMASGDPPLLRVICVPIEEDYVSGLSVQTVQTVL
jgi:hypothetical protein